MAIETSTAIKEYFETGDTPTEAQFINLIDSCIALKQKYDNTTALTAAHPTGIAGQVALVGTTSLELYAWNESIGTPAWVSVSNAMTDAAVKTAYENNADTNAFTDAEQGKLSGIETGATQDQTDAEIKTAYENNADTNAFTNAEQTKLGYLTLTSAANLDDINSGYQDKTAAEFTSGGIILKRHVKTYFGTRAAPVTSDAWALSGVSGEIQKGGKCTIFYNAANVPTFPTGFFAVGTDNFAASTLVRFDVECINESPFEAQFTVTQETTIGALSLTQSLEAVGSLVYNTHFGDPALHTNDSDVSPIVNNDDVKIVGDSVGTNATQTTAARQAVYTSSDKMLTFDATDDGYPLSGSVTYPATGCTVCFVTNITTTDQKAIIGEDISNYIMIQNGGLLVSKAGGARTITTTTGWISGGLQLTIMRTDGTDHEVFKNDGTTADTGTKYWTNTGAALTGSYTMNYIGSFGAAYYNNADKYHEKLGAICIFSKRLNDAEVNTVQSAFNSEFSIW